MLDKIYFIDYNIKITKKKEGMCSIMKKVIFTYNNYVNNAVFGYACVNHGFIYSFNKMFSLLSLN